ncbi:MAG TPA: integrin alpha, partial [Microthrixaceae bacterium]|nr:integrin alpha [Microthrixaceae bacterium]
MLHDAEADLTLLGAAGMSAGRSLASGGDLFGTPADELLIGGADGAWVVDVAAMLSPSGVPVTSDLDASWAAHLVSPQSGPLVGQVVGAMQVDGQKLAWVGDGIHLHVFHAPQPPGNPAPSLTLTWDDPVAPTEMISAAAVITWAGEPALAVGCSQCAPLAPGGPTLPGVVRVFSTDDLLGSVDLLPADALAAGQGTNANARFGQSLAAFSDGRLAIGSAGSSGGAVWITVPDDLSPIAMLLGSNSGRLGWATAIGDPNGDGAEEVLAGGPEALFGSTRFGMLRSGHEVPVTGGPPPHTPTPIVSPWYMQGPGGAGSLGPRFGQAVAVGDINGDGLDDILIGAPRAMDGVGQGLRTGSVVVILGGLPGAATGNQVTHQYLDPDGDGVGSGPELIRCTLVGALQAGDCDEGDPGRSPDHIELCGTSIDDDCIPENDGLLCEDRFATIPTQPGTDLSDSLWCYGQKTWEIGPGAADTVSIEDLVQMLDDESLFFDDFLDHGVVGSVGDVAACLAYAGGPSVILDVIDPASSTLDADLATSPYERLISDVVVDTLRNNPQGYLIGTWNLDDSAAQRMVILAADYPGLVNGVVDLLRATEDTETTRTLWRNQTVLDWPENSARENFGDPSSFQWCTPANDEEVTPADWPTCVAAQPGRDALDASLRYHYNRVRMDLGLSAPSRDLYGLAVNRQASYVREMTLYLRRRGIDPAPFATVVPDAVKTDEDPLGVSALPVMPVAGATGTWALPCAGEVCPEIADLPIVTPDWVANAKYAMSLTGDTEGLIFGRNMVTTDAVEARPGFPDFLQCRGGEVAALCGGGPCWCLSNDGATSGRDFTLDVRSPSDGSLDAFNGTADLIFADASDDSSTPWDGDREDWQYASLWGDEVFRPGRLYALRFTATLLDNGQSDRMTRVEVASRILFWDAQPVATLDLTASTPTRHVSFVLRAPLQGTELPAGEPDDYGGDPGVQLSLHRVTGRALAPVAFTGLAVVELDGLSNGWMEHPDLLPTQATLAVDEPGWDAAADAEVVTPVDLTGCAAAVSGCVPYVADLTCAGGAEAYTTSMPFERFAVDPDVAMPAPRLTRVHMEGPDPARLDGVVWPGYGTWQRDLCDANHGYPEINGVSNSKQSYEVFSPEYWFGPYGFPATLRYYGRPRFGGDTGPSIQDYLFGRDSEGDPYAWSQGPARLYVSILDEIRAFNRGLAAWHEGVYRPIPPHQLVRGLLCNLANMVNDPDWYDGGSMTHQTVPYYSYCDYFSADGGDCHGATETESLSGVERCSLDRVSEVSSSGVRLVVDSGMYRDNSTFDFRGDYHAGTGSLSMGYFTADIDQLRTTRPGGATVPNTMADLQDSRVWQYESTKQDMLEGVCDVTDISEFFLDQPGLGETFEPAVEDDRNACQMSGHSHPGTVQGNGTIGTPDSLQNWAIVGAGHPEVVDELVVG